MHLTLKITNFFLGSVQNKYWLNRYDKKVEVYTFYLYQLS